jgi:DNA-binding NarL/FixJ family response regulator
MHPISIILADRQYLIRTGLKSLFAGKEHLKIVGEASNEAELMDQLRQKPADLVILDHNQPNSFSKETVERLKTDFPNTNILIISADNHKESIYEILEKGINSFLTKSCDGDEIIDAVKAAAKGEKFFCTRVLDYLLEKSFAKEQDGNCSPTPLSPREIEIVQLVAQGLIAKEIADALNLSTHTIYTHRKNIMKKLKLNTASELVIYAVHTGLVKR